MSVRSPLDLDYCIKWCENGRGMFGNNYTSVTPVMAEHVQEWISRHARVDREAARLHTFEYMTTAMKLTKARANFFWLCFSIFSVWFYEFSGIV